MKPTENLFLLIKSLTKAEKKYFKRFCTLYSAEKKNNYFRLFEYLDKQNEYDETKIKQYFRNEGFVRHLSVSKDYLYKIILKSISTMRSSHEMNYELRESVLECEILISKGLYKQSRKKIKSVKEQLYKFGYYILLLELIGYEKTTINELALSQQNKYLLKVIREEEIVIEHIVKIRKVLNLQRELMMLLKSLGMPLRNESDILKISAIINSLDYIQVRENDSLQAKTILSHAKIAAYMSITNYKKAYKESLNLLNILKSNKIVNLKDPRNLYGALHNLVYLSLNLRNRKKTLQYMEELERFINTISFKIPTDTTNNIYCNFLILQLMVDNRFFNCDNSSLLIKNFKEYYLRNKSYLSNEIYIDGISVIVTNLIIKGDLEHALIHNNYIINTKKEFLRNDVFIITSLNNIIINYELNNYDYVDSQVNNFNKFLVSTKKSNVLELLIVKYFKKLTNFRNEKRKSEILFSLRTKLSELSGNPRVYRLLNDYYFMEWIDAKINNKSMKEIITNQNSKQLFNT